MNLRAFLVAVALMTAVRSTDSTHDESEGSASPANIVFIMMDDLGRSDIGAFGAEWDTPNLDSFLSESVILSHHYIGYVCSVSRSQFLTGRYSFHSGYGALDVFDCARLGHVPFQTPMLQEYLKQYKDYQNYAIGKWQLGSPSFDNMALSRGFDQFYGYNGGILDYYDKTSRITDVHVDFWENSEPTNAWVGGYSTDQYFEKMKDVLTEHNDIYGSSKPFFMYAALQAIHNPFPDYASPEEGTDYYRECYYEYIDTFDDFSNRINVCECMLGIDYQFGLFMDFLRNDPKMQANNVYDNTIILFTSDNGGSLDMGSCNYPLRGGKNTFYEGNVRVLAAVGGGKLPQFQQGKILDGLVSNVDWLPTFLSFAGIIDEDQEMVLFDDDSNFLSLDGYNMHNYIMQQDTEASRDHIMFHLKPALTEKNYFIKNIQTYHMQDMEEIAMVFYDDDGSLWKYLDAPDSTNVIGNIQVNGGWCALSATLGDGSNNTYEFVSRSASTHVGLWKLSEDVAEESNYLINGADIESTKYPGARGLKEIIEEKIDFYVNAGDDGSKNAEYLYGNFFCFVNTSSQKPNALVAAKKAGFWVPWMKNREDLALAVSEDCELDLTHPLYKLYTTDWTLPSDPHEMSVMDQFDERRVEMKQSIDRVNSRVATQKERIWRDETENKIAGGRHTHMRKVVDLDAIKNVEVNGKNEGLSSSARDGSYSTFAVGSNWSFGVIGVLAVFLIALFACMVVCGKFDEIENKLQGYELI